MAVNVQKPANAAESTSQAQESAVPKTISLELATYTRWVDNREPSKPLYEKGKEYVFVEGVAMDMLQLHENGLPIFRRYKAKPARRVVVEENAPVDMTKAAPRKPAAEGASATRVDIGGDDELKELMTDTPEEGAGDTNDEAAHEV